MSMLLLRNTNSYPGGVHFKVLLHDLNVFASLKSLIFLLLHTSTLSILSSQRKCWGDCLRHPPQGIIYLNQQQPGPLSDPHIAIATTAWPLRYEQCDGANGAG